MNVLEIIEIRSVRTAGDLKNPDLRKIIRIPKQELGPVEIRFYQNRLVATDLSIHLHYDTKSVSMEQETLGLRLVAELRQYGLVNHAYWLAMSK